MIPFVGLGVYGLGSRAQGFGVSLQVAACHVAFCVCGAILAIGTALSQ